MESSLKPLAGLYRPQKLAALYYGPSAVKNNLLSCLPSETSKAFIITGNSLATKTPLIKQVEDLLTSKHHAGTFSNIKEHAPIAQLDEATAQVLKDDTIDTIISIGGGSPIDSAKAISYRTHEKGGNFLTHIAIPTTLSAAECSFGAGYTGSDGVKTGVGHPDLVPSHLLYDPSFGLYTPPHLFLSTAIPALDHAVEMQYYPTATLIPCRTMALDAIKTLFTYLPLYKSNPKDEDTITHLFLAAYSSLGFLGASLKGPLGLSHTLGYALGSPYGIPHGVTSCLTLGHVVKLKASSNPADASSIAAILPASLDKPRTGDDVKDSEVVGDAILELVRDLGLKTTLTEKGVGKDQVDLIVERATGGTVHRGAPKANEEALKGVKKLVEGLY